MLVDDRAAEVDDLPAPLEGTDRFLAVRGDADRILTCFLEYLDADTVRVHDLLHLRTPDGWTLHTGSYPKLRLAADWLADRCREAGLEVSTTGWGRAACGCWWRRAPREVVHRAEPGSRG
ncbi:hypothetical protein [Streptomyces cuspidosporus]|uniref:Uncharacterized protein n=1 Tax=Streptomyces cuspidosporus TaxID=66882 RepID=A0ABP5TD39_9ACTN